MTAHLPEDTHRRALLLALLGTALPLTGLAQERMPIEVWKDPQCGCCKDWVAHLETNGFGVKVNETGNNAARARLGVQPRYGACHTAQVAGYAIEGHVPAAEIRRLLAQKPAAIGLAVPGMPIGSPGMDGAAYGGRKQAFDVLLLAGDGSASVFAHYRGHAT